MIRRRLKLSISDIVTRVISNTLVTNCHLNHVISACDSKRGVFVLTIEVSVNQIQRHTIRIDSLEIIRFQPRP